MDINSITMLKEDHLSEEEIAMCADAISTGRYALLEKTIKSHLEACSMCGNEVLMVSEINKQAESFQKNIQKRKNIVRILVAFASAAALLLLLVLFYFQRNYFPYQPQIAETNIDSANKADHAIINNLELNDGNAKIKNDGISGMNSKSQLKNSDKQISNTVQLALYETNPALEKLFDNYGNSYRSSGFVFSGSRVIEYPEVINIEWINPGKASLEIEIFNNKNEKINSFTSSGSGVGIPELTPGLYYFKIITEDFDLLFVGKIRVKESPDK